MVGSDKVTRVLFVEDAFDQAVLVKAFLGAMGGFYVVHAQDGERAAQLVRDETWDILITDLNLPGIDGFELCRIAKSAHPGLPVLAVTGYTGAHYQEQAFRAGATDLLTKPLEKEEFQAKVGELTGRAVGPSRPNVLAVSALVGDAEMGCAGALLRHAKDGADVTIVVLSGEESGAGGVGLIGAQQAAEGLGFRLMVDEDALVDTQSRVAFMQRIVKELQPKVAYVPAMDDAHPLRRETFRIARAAAAGVPSVLAYQTATTGHEFRPTRFQDVGDVLVDKMVALTCYADAGLQRLDLSPRMAQAYARYWGRLQRFSEVEAFEQVHAPE
ncbi:MAG TPA: response regulator [Longimicrobiales bacterium]|nr:response regulator [Longimicrobiales bacterium]